MVRGQIEEISTGLSSKLRERIFSFGTDSPGQERVSPSTMSDVNKLVA